MDGSKSQDRIVVIPFIHGKLTADGNFSEPDIYYILEKWLQRHPESRGREREFRISRGNTHLPGGHPTDLVRVTAKFSADLAGYVSDQDADLYEYFLADESRDQA